MSRYTWRTFGLEVGMIAVTILFAFPLYVLVNRAVRPEGELSSPLAMQWPPTLENYGNAWHQAGLGRAIFDSLVITIGSVVVVVVVSAMAAYPLARSTARLSRWMFGLFM